MTTKTATKTQEVEAVVYEETTDQPVVVEKKRSRFVKEETEEKPKGRIRKWVANKLTGASEFLSDDERVHAYTGKVKKKLVIAGVGALGLAAVGAIAGMKSDSEGSLDGCDVDQDHYLEDGESDYNDGDYYVEESVEVTEEI